MIEFWIALAVFIGSHGVIARSPLRQMAINRIGEKAYLFLYSLLSVILLTWVIDAAINAPRVLLWPWIHGLYWIPNILMPLAFILLTAGLSVPNPLSVSLRNIGFNPEQPPMTVSITRHPVMWGFFLWSFSHIFPNGEFPLAFMFGLFAFFALLGTKTIDRLRKRQFGAEKWHELSCNTSSLPFANTSFWKGRFQITKTDIAGIFTGLALYAVFLHLHRTFFGVIPIPPLA